MKLMKMMCFVKHCDLGIIMNKKRLIDVREMTAKEFVAEVIDFADSYMIKIRPTTFDEYKEVMEEDDPKPGDERHCITLLL